MTAPEGSHTRLHHVVFAVAPERLDAAVEYLTELGFEFQALELDHLGLQVRLDWERGFELISPGPDAPHEPGTAADFLARHGDGLFSVVVRVPDSSAAEDVARRHGAVSDFSQAFEGDGYQLSEVKLEPLFGIPLTLLQTNVE
jgi:4-hydroxyphenylpyruvate dioxygenase-like putative hemolysin